MKSALKIVVIAGVVGAFASFFFATSFYYRDLPSKPQPELGRIYPINNHGYPLYLTKQEGLEQTFSDVLAVVLFISAGIVNHFFDPFGKSKEQLPPKTRAPWNHRWGPS